MRISRVLKISLVAMGCLLLVAWMQNVMLNSAGLPTARAAGSTYTVDETIDDANATACTAAANDCSLRGAIIAANANPSSTIILPTGVYTLTLTGAAEDAALTGDLDINATMNISGAGASSTIVQGGPGWNDRIFDVRSGTVQISGLTIRNGNASSGSGGAILNAGQLDLKSIDVVSNTAIYGGGLYNMGSLVITHSQFALNRTNSGSGWGGGLVSLQGSSLVIQNTSFTTNTAWMGGAIMLFNQIPASVTLKQLTVVSNSATYAGALFCSACQASIESSLLDRNHANSGGAIYSSLAKLTLNNSQITHNSGGLGGGVNNFLGALTVTNGLVAFNYASGEGAGFYNDLSGTLLLSGTVVSTNTAWSNGGGLFNAQNAWSTVVASLFTSNVVTSLSYNGGAIDNYGYLQVMDSRLISNTAGGGAGAFGNSGVATVTRSSLSGNVTLDGAGGAIFNYVSATLTIDRSTLDGNFAPVGSGGGVINEGALRLTNSTLSGNHAQADGGGLWHWSVHPGDDAILNSVTIVSNTVDISHTGGGIYVLYNTSVLTASNVLLSSNRREAGSATDCSGVITSLGYNLIETTTGCLITGTLTGVITNTDSLIGPLQANGGSTWTHALLPGSPAINAGDPNPAHCPATDQRGVARPIGPRCDIGAYEAPLWVYLPLALKNF